jgi:hypothetical protein
MPGARVDELIIKAEIAPTTPSMSAMSRAVSGIRYLLILQQQMLSQAAAVVAALGACLVAASPARPVQPGRGRRQDAHDEAIDKPTDLGKGERD